MFALPVRIPDVASLPADRRRAASSTSLRGFASSLSQAQSQHAESSAQAQARENREQFRLKLREQAAEQATRLANNALPAYLSKRWDSAAVDPARSLERLSTLPLTTPSKSFLVPDGPFPVEGTPAGDEAEAERVRMNDAVHNFHVGVQYQDWERAFEHGWTPLFEKGEQDRVDMLTAERLITLLGRQPDSYVAKHWPTIVERLLVPLARRQVGSEVSSNVGIYLAKTISRHAGDPTWIRRVVTFWETFNKDVQARHLAEYFGHPSGLLQIPANLFTAVLLNYYQGYALCNDPDYSLSAFLRSGHGVIAVPPRFGVAGAMQVTSQTSKYLASNKEHASALEVWFGQCELYRTWQRQGDYGLRRANDRWRERRSESAAEYLWTQIRSAVRRPTDPNCWWTIDWRDEVYRNKDKTSAKDGATAAAESLNSVLDPAQPNEREGSASAPMQGQAVVLPAKFTPALASEFIHTFLHLDMQRQADEVWDFCEKHLGLSPTLIMWNARLLGYSAMRRSTEVERVFMEMETKGGIKADAVSWSILVNSYFRSGRADSGLERMQQMLSNKALRDSQPDGKLPVRVYNIMLNALLWGDSKAAADQFLENMVSDDPEAPGADIYTVNILLRYYSRAKSFDLARISETMELVERYQLEPDHYTFTTILDALLRAGRPDAVDRIQLMMQNMQVQATTATYGAMIHHLIKSSHYAENDVPLQAALSLLRKMQNGVASTDGEGAPQSVPKPSEITYTSLIQGFARWATDRDSPRHLLVAEQLHAEMLSLHIPPNRITYNSLMTASLAANDIAKAMLYFRAHRDMKRRRSSSTPASLIHSSNARVDSDDSLQDETVLMSEKISPRTWQALVAGLTKYKHWSEARSILDEMKAAGVTLKSPAFERMVRKIQEMTKERDLSL